MNVRPRKPRFRLSVRALMALVLVVAVVLGWKVNRARNQRLAVAAIRAKGGRVSYDFAYGADLKTLPMWEPAAPKWLRKALGDEYFQEVTMVTLLSRSDTLDDFLPSLGLLDHLEYLRSYTLTISDSALAQLATYPSLQTLIVSAERDGPSDEGLASLAGARKLRELMIEPAAGVTDPGMASLAKLPELKVLRISDAPSLTALGLKNLGPRLAELEGLILLQTGLSDEGMACLGACRKLKLLNLNGAKLGNAGFFHVRHMESLRLLSIESTNVTDEGLAALRGLKELRGISLANTQIAGPGLVHLEALDQLEDLDLGETPLTDEWLGPIRKLRGLQTLNLIGTKVTAQAVAALRAERPSLSIHHHDDPMPPPPPPAPALAPK